MSYLKTPTNSTRARGSRKSIAYQPNSGMNGTQSIKEGLGLIVDDKENAGRQNSTKKTRSKSLGPGELQEMADDSQNNDILYGVTKAAPKSILQPAIPISPLQQIPVHHSARKTTNITFAPPIMVPLRSEREQQEAKEQREAERTVALSHRANRRKSLGNRRVSFNPEVTMHLLQEQKTPSTGGTQATRTPGSTNSRIAAAATPTPVTQTEDVERPHTTQEQEDDVILPEPIQTGYKKGNLKAPMTPGVNFNNPNDVSSSPTPSSAFSSSPGVVLDEVESVLAPDDSSDDDEDAMSVVSPTVTTRTEATMEMSDNDSGEDMDLAEEFDITAAFKPWIVRKQHNHPKLSHPETNFRSAPPKPMNAKTNDDDDDQTMDVTQMVGQGVLASPTPTSRSDGEATMDFTRVVGQGLMTKLANDEDSDGEEMTMDVTKAIGGILPSSDNAPSWHNLQPVKISNAFGSEDDNNDMTMDITRVIGQGVLDSKPVTATEVDPTMSPSERRLSQTRTRRSLQSNSSNTDEQTMDMTRVVGGIQSWDQEAEADDDEEMTMEFTKVIGGVLGNARPAHQSAQDDSEAMDMEVTRVVGGILKQEPHSSNEMHEDIEGDMSESMDIDMEVTTVIGGILARPMNQTTQSTAADEVGAQPATPLANPSPKASNIPSIVAHEVEPDLKATPDYFASRASRDDYPPTSEVLNNLALRTESPAQSLTRKRNQVSPSPHKRRTPVERHVAQNVDHSVTETPTRRTRSQAKIATPKEEPSGEPQDESIMITGVSHGLPSKSRVARGAPSMSVEPPAPLTPNTAAVINDETQGTSNMLSVNHGLSAKRRVTGKDAFLSSPSKGKGQDVRMEHVSPLRIMSTPEPAIEAIGHGLSAKHKKAVSPKQPIVVGIEHGLSSKHRATSPSIEPAVASVGHGLSAKRRVAGGASPSVSSTPTKASSSRLRATPNSQKRHSGVGISKPGLGSPALHKVLSKRKSLGEHIDPAESFSPGVKTFSSILKEIGHDKSETQVFEKEIMEDKIVEPENLRQLINKMTPRKEPQMSVLKSSSAGPIKRLFGEMKDHQNSISSEKAPETSSPIKKKTRNTPPQELSKRPSVLFTLSPKEAIERDQVKRTASDKENEDPFAPTVNIIPAQPKESDENLLIVEDNAMDISSTSQEEVLPNMSMQDFLSITSISFLDNVTATKRRQTGAFTPLGHGLGRPSIADEEEVTMADRTVANLVIIPNLELFQHSCRELRNNISAGRSLTKQIEKRAKEDNPPLFHEYRISPPNVQALMDMQFKDIKEFARLQAKQKWYDWRMSLMETLKQAAADGLKPLKEDQKTLHERNHLAEEALPSLADKHQKVELQAKTLRTRQAEISACDPVELENARKQLDDLLKSIEDKKAEAEGCEATVRNLDETLLMKEETKDKLLHEIENAERLKEANKGFSMEDISKLEDNVHQLEKKYNWTINTVTSASHINMTYNSEIQVMFDMKNLTNPAALQLISAETTIQKSYFFNQLSDAMKTKQFESPQLMLKYVQLQWDKSLGFVEEIRKLELHFPIVISTVEEHAQLSIKAALLVRERKAKIMVEFLVYGDKKQEVDIKCETVYGDHMKGWKLDEFLKQLIKEQGVGWKDGILQLGQQLIAK